MFVTNRLHPLWRVVYYLTQKFTHSRSFLNFLKLIVLLSQQMSRWLKSFSRMRSCEHNASCSWNKKAWWVGSLWSGMTIFAQYFSKVFYWQGKKRVSEYLNKCLQKITSKCKYINSELKPGLKSENYLAIIQAEDIQISLFQAKELKMHTNSSALKFTVFHLLCNQTLFEDYL